MSYDFGYSAPYILLEQSLGRYGPYDHNSDATGEVAGLACSPCIWVSACKKGKILKMGS